VSISIGGGGGGVWNEVAPPSGAGGGALPCDFGTCEGATVPGGNGFGPGAAVGALKWPWFYMKVTSWGSLWPIGLGALDAGLLVYDVYQGYHLAQA
jgi:hypothetical protein